MASTTLEVRAILFQPHSRLTFKSNVPRETQQSSGSVKQASHGSRGESSNSFADQLQSVAVARSKDERGCGEIWQPIQLRQKSRGGLHRRTRSGIAAGQRCVAHMCAAYKALFHAADENFSTPDGAIVTKAGAVKAHAYYLFRPTRHVPPTPKQDVRGDVAQRVSSRQEFPKRGRSRNIAGDNRGLQAGQTSARHTWKSDRGSSHRRRGKPGSAPDHQYAG